MKKKIESKKEKVSIPQRFKLFKKKSYEKSHNIKEDLKEIHVTGEKRILGNKLADDKFYFEATDFTEKYGLTKRKIKKQAKFYKEHIEKVVLIKMEMGNGMFREFLINEDNGCFFYKKNMYVIDVALRYFLIDRNIWCYDYHEFLSLPLRKTFQIDDKLEAELQPIIDADKKKPLNPHTNVDEIKTLVENSNLVDVEASINPTTLKRFTDSEVIKQVLQGAMLSKIFKIMFVLIVVIAIFMLILLIIQLYTSGIIQDVVGGFQ